MTTSRSRRRWLTGLGGWMVASVAGPAHGDDLEQRRLRNRIELWANFSKRTSNLVARLTTTRESAYFREPLVTSGELIFQAGGPLIFHDEGMSGSTTWISSEELLIVPNRTGSQLRPLTVSRQRPAAQWLADRLYGLFAPGDGDGLLEQCRADVPRGGYRLEFMPPRNSQTRRVIRGLGVHLDPVAGAVTQILVEEAQGDRLRLQLADHRQNIPGEDLRKRLDDLARLRPQ